jgi:hypothetical protein
MFCRGESLQVRIQNTTATSSYMVMVTWIQTENDNGVMTHRHWLVGALDVPDGVVICTPAACRAKLARPVLQVAPVLAVESLWLQVVLQGEVVWSKLEDLVASSFLPALNDPPGQLHGLFLS